MEETKTVIVQQEESKLQILPCIIIGAGAAGIGAGRILKRQGIEALILEGRDRVGGRVLTKKMGDSIMDLGAGFIHDIGGQGNPIPPLIKEYKIPLHGWNRNYDKRYVFDQEEYIPSKDVQKIALAGYNKLINVCETLANEDEFQNKTHKKISIWKAIEGEYENLLKRLEAQQQTALKKRLVDYYLNRTEHYEAASLEEITYKYFNLQCNFSGDGQPVNGYQDILIKASEGLKIEFNHKIVKIDYSQKDVVTITTKDGVNFVCKTVLVTVPLGVLKNNCIEIIPQLPKAKIDAIQNIGFGLMNKIFIEFSEEF